MRYVGLLAGVGLLLAVTGTAGANTVESSTMYFSGTLTQAGSAYTGTIDMTAGTYYMPGGPGEYAHDGGSGGFDVYAKAGGTAYVSSYSPQSATVGADHDAYSQGGDWGAWYDPDCADWDYYELELTSSKWYLRYKSPGEETTYGANPSPMSGSMDWTNLIASETDAGTQYGYQSTAQPDQSTDHGGGPGAWDWACQSHVEVIPLEYGDFAVSITETSLGSGVYNVSLTPVPEPVTMAGLVLGIGCLARYVRRRRTL